MAVSNSCMNPLVYGSYAMKCRCPWNRKKRKDVALGAVVGVLQRRSTGNIFFILNEKFKFLINYRLFIYNKYIFECRL